MKNILSCILTCFVFFSCKKDDVSNSIDNLNSHIKYFGFTIIDTHWDDPTDSELKTNYADEIHTFSNLADILVINPTDNIIQRTETFSALDLKPILHLSELFFQVIDSNSPSGSNYDLRPNYEERWNTFKNTNQAILNTNYIGAFYIGEEPTWNGISFAELNQVTLLLKTDFPSVPIMIIEAYPSLDQLQIPELIDWVGFDRYFIKNPNEDSEFQQNWQTLKSKLTSPSQKIMIVMDSHYLDWAHGNFGNINLLEMDIVANNYYQLAQSDEKVIGILGYFWPSGFDFPNSVGARNMPENIKENYSRIGKEITNKQ
ncbi:hypothetical protein [Winogradskyella sp. PE311]|uniref:hypothetical protein n=1 Tax=Winogradskyella sp. PE311 TaxID=3366943 RepID=UPI0039817727